MSNQLSLVGLRDSFLVLLTRLHLVQALSVINISYNDLSFLFKLMNIIIGLYPKKIMTQKMELPERATANIR